MQLRRLRPLSEGRPRGTPIVRHYWTRFLDRHREDIRGRALEIGSTDTLERLGGDAVLGAEALDLAADSGRVTVVADLARADSVPSDTYDCFVVPFTMHVVYDVDAALYHAIRILRPGGVLLVNFPCVDYYFSEGLDMGTGPVLYPFHWFTPIEVENLFRRLSLGDDDYEMVAYGNLFARIAYEVNMGAEELTASELAHVDPGHPLIVCGRIVKPPTWDAVRPVYREAWTPAGAARRWTPERGHYA
jgi:SAM-dependent methyltransferase